MADVKPTQHYTCTSCPTTRDSVRLPKGWKVIRGVVTCNTCVSGNWVTRAVRLEVREFVADADAPVPEAFLPPWHQAWRLSTDLANWAGRELLVHDVRRTPDMETLPEYVSLNLYRHWNTTVPEATRRAWDGATQSAAAVLKLVEQKWKADRYKALWRGNVTPSFFRYPHPVVVPAQAARLGWRTHPGGGRVPVVSLLLPGFGRVAVAADHGRDWKRNIALYDLLASGAAVRGDVRVVARRDRDRVTGVALFVAGRFPVATGPGGTKVATVRTAPDALLVVEVPGRQPFYLYRPDLIGHVAARSRYRDWRAHDLKREKRWPAEQRRRFVLAGQPATAKYDHRVRTITQQCVRSVADFVARQRCATVEYDDTNQTYCRDYRYYDLREGLRSALTAAGIAFQPVNQQPGGI